MTAADGQAADPWLAVIDMQRVFADPASGWFAPRIAETVGPIKELVAAFRPKVVFTRFQAPEVPSGAWKKYYEQWPFALQGPDSEIYRLIEDFTFEAGPTVDATTFAKWTPELAAKVGSAGRLVLAGVTTDCCVLSTAIAAADAGVEVRVVAEACAGASDDSHRQALELMRLYAPLIEVVTLAGVLAGTGGPQFGTPGGDGADA